MITELQCKAICLKFKKNGIYILHVSATIKIVIQI